MPRTQGTSPRHRPDHVPSLTPPRCANNREIWQYWRPSRRPEPYQQNSGKPSAPKPGPPYDAGSRSESAGKVTLGGGLLVGLHNGQRAHPSWLAKTRVRGQSAALPQSAVTDRGLDAIMGERLRPRPVVGRRQALHLPVRRGRARPARPAARRCNDQELRGQIAAIWARRADRYSELRTRQASHAHKVRRKVEMSHIGG
jgi:hypothetical protein